MQRRKEKQAENEEKQLGASQNGETPVSRKQIKTR
jgi:hypothetical protein